MEEVAEQRLARKQRGAFFTPPAIAEFLVRWAIGEDPAAHVLDPTCGDGAFLRAAVGHLQRVGVAPDRIGEQVHGVDLHVASLRQARQSLPTAATAHLLEGDFFAEATPAQLNARLPWMDAIVGNPPFVRYQDHKGEARSRSAAAALAQGVRLSGLASSWAAVLVHASAFLRPEGRIAMVLPSEFLTVGYAEPVRRWLKQRFGLVHLVLFEELQFSDAEEQVILLVAGGRGGCDAFALHTVRGREDLAKLHPFDSKPVAPGPSGKWTDLLVPHEPRSLYRSLVGEAYVPLADYGQPVLGTVTGANAFFALSEPTRKKFGIPPAHLVPIMPPGSRHAPGVRFTRADWEQLRTGGARVWLLQPRDAHPASVARYIDQGDAMKVHEAYKCSVRTPWWRPPVGKVPHLFFTYMSHRFPRLIENGAGVRCLNSLHALRLGQAAPDISEEGLPLLALNSASLLGAEVTGRSYGGGVLKMEPLEAAAWPVPSFDVLEKAWPAVCKQKLRLETALRAGQWEAVVEAVDQSLVSAIPELRAADLASLRVEAQKLRRRRTRRAS